MLRQVVFFVLFTAPLMGQTEAEKLMNLIAGLETSSVAAANLSRITSLHCVLGAGYATDWAKGYPSSDRDRMTKTNDPTIFYEINLEAGKARMMGNLGTGEVFAFKGSAGGLTFLEATKGGFNMTTVFATYSKGTKMFPCAHSRHLLVMGMNPMPSQYHGTCQASN